MRLLRAGRLLPWRGRRLAVVLAVAAALAMLAGALTGVQLRAAQAQDRREEVAALDAAAARASQAEAARRAQAQARLDDFLEASDRLQAWAAAAQQAQIALADADAALAASVDQVADDAVRVSLAAVAQQVRDLLAAGGEEPSQEQTAALTAATTAVGEGVGVVAAAQAAWLAEQEEQEEEARARAARPRGWPHDGAGPDCGGPESYEPSTGGTFFTSVPTDDGDGSNGNMPRAAMAPLAWCADSRGNQQWLRADAAAALTALNEAFRAQFGENIAVDLSYRSYADQVRARELYGSLAAQPGTSNHGLGTAFDTWEWDAYDFGTPRYEWLVANGPAHGWVSLTVSDPGNPEYWHFDFTG